MSANGADSSRWNMPVTVGVGYSLIPSIAPNARFGGGSVFKHFDAKDQPARGEDLVERRARQGYAPPLPVNKIGEKLQNLGVSTLVILVQTQQFRFVSVEGCLERLAQLLGGIE